MKLSHQELCFGCGTANLFGLQMELEQRSPGTVAGRFFLKQDHQGRSGKTHEGVIAAALDEAMSLAIHAEGTDALTSRIEVGFDKPVPIGAFVNVEATITERARDRVSVEAVAHGSDPTERLAHARGQFVRVKGG